ncbi:MAG: hypothetical protein R3272_14045, partial [Candidatus Promineifilaceae bacterium]|nr:hypothetical protein [Candidatus Promineifilaceae bacterium]
RMAGFMLVAIMSFEEIALRPAVGRLRSVAAGSAVAVLGGLALTKLVTLASIIAVMFVPESVGFLIFLPLGLLWILGLYVEQIFVTGLYLYTAMPDSRLVAILLEDFVGDELPGRSPGWTEQPVT